MTNKPIIARAGGGGDFETPEAGSYIARCYKIVDVGTQTTQSQFGTKEVRQVYIWWELLGDEDGAPAQMMADGRPFSVMASYTLSMHPKAKLRAHLELWRGKKFTEEEASAFDITKLLGVSCRLQIDHTPSKDGTRTYVNVENISFTKKQLDGVNPLVSFSVEEPDEEVFASLPDFIKRKIEVAPETKFTASAYPDDEPVAEIVADDNTIKGSELPF